MAESTVPAGAVAAMKARTKKPRKATTPAQLLESTPIAGRIAQLRAREHYLRDLADKHGLEAKRSPQALPGQRAEYFRRRSEELLALWEWQKTRDERIALQVQLEVRQ